jgi:hypothetical protein
LGLATATWLEGSLLEGLQLLTQPLVLVTQACVFRLQFLILQPARRLTALGALRS